MPVQQPTIGRLVSYIDAAGDYHPAIITAIDGTDASGTTVWLTISPTDGPPQPVLNSVQYGQTFQGPEWRYFSREPESTDDLEPVWVAAYQRAALVAATVATLDAAQAGVA